MIDFVKYDYDNDPIKDISVSELELSYDNDIHTVVIEIMRDELCGIYKFINVENVEHFNYHRDCVCFSIDTLLVKAETEHGNKRAYLFKVHTDNNIDVISFYGWQLY